jgi:hypothetical protein
VPWLSTCLDHEFYDLRLGGFSEMALMSSIQTVTISKRSAIGQERSPDVWSPNSPNLRGVFSEIQAVGSTSPYTVRTDDALKVRFFAKGDR